MVLLTMGFRKRCLSGLRNFRLYYVLIIILITLSPLIALPIIPDGSGGGVIIYSVTHNDGTNSLHLMNANGSGQEEISGLTGRNLSPTWSPDASQIAFYKHLSDDVWSLFIMDSSGVDIQQIPNQDNSLNWAPSWKTSGDKLLYTKSFMSPVWRSEIWQMNPDGTNAEQIGTVDGQGGDYSPDGSKIVYFNYVENGGDIWLMNPDGSGVQRLTFHAAEDWWPNWSPDGTQIVFQSKRNGNFDIYKMNVDGSNLIRLTNDPADDEEPRWSPDGSRIVFSSKRDGHYEIYTMKADGSEQTRLTNTNGQAINPDWMPVLSYCGQLPPGDDPERFGSGSLLATQYWQWHGSPMFSPDGKEMFFAKYVYQTANEGEGSEIWTTRLENNRWTEPEIAPFTNRLYNDNNPFYVSDDCLYFKSQRNNGFLYKVNKVNGVWGTPQPVYVPIMQGYSFGWQFSIAQNGNLYAEVYDNSNNGDLYCWTYENGQYLANPQNLSVLNSESLDFSPYIDPLERYIIYATNRDFGGYNHKLYISHKENGVWLEPVIMSSLINESYVVQPMVTRDEKYFFYNTCISGDLGMNTYWVKLAPFLHPSSNDDQELPAPAEMSARLYPNPFNPETTIELFNPAKEDVNVSVYNVKGQKVKVLHQGMLDKGEHKLFFKGKDEHGRAVSSGIYFIRVQTASKSYLLKSLLLK